MMLCMSLNSEVPYDEVNSGNMSNSKQSELGIKRILTQQKPWPMGHKVQYDEND